MSGGLDGIIPHNEEGGPKAERYLGNQLPFFVTFSSSTLIITNACNSL